MAQWTADKWADYGFKSRLDEYCKHSHLLLHTGDSATWSLEMRVLTTASRIPQLPGLKLPTPHISQWKHLQADSERGRS